MPFEIVRNDITNMRVDAVVNTANPKPVVGAGTDSMIHEKAGPEQLKTRQMIGCIICRRINSLYSGFKLFCLLLDVGVQFWGQRHIAEFYMDLKLTTN